MTETDLSEAMRLLTGETNERVVVPQLGPGITYLLALPDREIRYLEKSPDAFPSAFFQLAESVATWDHLVDPRDREIYANSFANDRPEREASYHIAVNRRGATSPVKDYRQELLNGDGVAVGVIGRIVDDSLRNLALDSLTRRSWREISMSLTRRFLHDFNNTIAGIYSLSELYAEPGSEPKSMVEAMVHIRDCSIRAQEITRRIRHLTNLDVGQVSYFDLRKLVREQDEYLLALLPKGVQIDYQIDGEQMPVHLDANQFRQAILHIVSNAFDAAGSDIILQIRLLPHASDKGSFAALEVQDNGPGFKEPELARAEEPFFSTKNDEKHPGLGLSFVKSFVESAGGALELCNGDTGALIRLIFPVLNLANDSEMSRIPNSKTAPPGATPSGASDAKPASSPPAILVYTWEDIGRHPLLIAMKDAGWSLRVHLDPGQLLVDLSQSSNEIDGVLVFKSALDEKAEPLLSELGRARDCGKIALLALGESVEALAESVKRNCGLIAPGTSKPTALLNKLAKYYC